MAVFAGLPHGVSFLKWFIIGDCELIFTEVVSFSLVITQAKLGMFYIFFQSDIQFVHGSITNFYSSNSAWELETQNP